MILYYDMDFSLLCNMIVWFYFIKTLCTDFWETCGNVMLVYEIHNYNLRTF